MSARATDSPSRGNPPRIDIIVVAAVAENGVIGRDNALPWRLKSDMAHFRAVTSGKPVIMGRKTFISIGKPLKGRTNIVVSRNPDYAAPGVVAAPSLDAAFAVARGDVLRRGADGIAVIGGSFIFREAMAVARRLEITVVHDAPKGDTFFPEIDPTIWRETARLRHPAAPQDDADFSLVTYERLTMPSAMA